MVVYSHEHFVWISSRGPRMHTHFDQDRNVFVQLYGEKLFTLFPPSSSDDLYMFPRLHPLWHKSQVHFDEPDLDKFPNYRRAEAFEAHLYPGDVLYIPPYWWHHVESLTASISVSQWSKLNIVTNAMNAIYGKVKQMHQLS
jgi:hypoxia-inducible factor 1-alpha inhibitor (HIF hydroxylase)